MDKLKLCMFATEQHELDPPPTPRVKKLQSIEKSNHKKLELHSNGPSEYKKRDIFWELRQTKSSKKKKIDSTTP